MKVFKAFFDESAGYVIFLNVGKGGFNYRGCFWNGIVFEVWKKIGMADLKK